MKKRPISRLNELAVKSAVDAALALRPDIDDASIHALLGMVARETARNLSESLIVEGYLNPISEEPKEPKPTADEELKNVVDEFLNSVFGPTNNNIFGSHSRSPIGDIMTGIKAVIDTNAFNKPTNKRD
jgi:hypothetical protein